MSTRHSMFGWIYHNPDAGVEWSENHPVRSGEVPDAERIMPATENEQIFASELSRVGTEGFYLRDVRDAAKQLMEVFGLITGTEDEGSPITIQTHGDHSDLYAASIRDRLQKLADALKRAPAA